MTLRFVHYMTGDMIAPLRHIKVVSAVREWLSLPPTEMGATIFFTTVLYLYFSRFRLYKVMGTFLIPSYSM